LPTLSRLKTNSAFISWTYSRKQRIVSSRKTRSIGCKKFPTLSISPNH
jgi:hypothetical protein